MNKFGLRYFNFFTMAGTSAAAFYLSLSSLGPGRFYISIWVIASFENTASRFPENDSFTDTKKVLMDSIQNGIRMTKSIYFIGLDCIIHC